MKKLLALVFFSLTLTGCPSYLQIHEPPPAGQPAVTDPVIILQNSLDQSYATHAAITATLLQNYHDGVITKDEKTAYAARTRTVLDYLDKADSLLAAGNLSDANAQLQLAQTIITQLQAELARYAKKQKGQGN